MPKRLTATEKWDDPWFFNLSNEHKLLWMYILDKCDHAGIFQLNKKMAEFCIGNKLNWEQIHKIFNSRIIKLSNEKWFIPKFVKFQYGELNPENRAHNSVINILIKEGVYKGLNRGLIDPIDIDKDKNKDSSNTHSTRFIKPSIEEIEKYAREIEYDLDAEKFYNSYETKDWHVGKSKMKNWKAAVRNWKYNRWGEKTEKKDLPMMKPDTPQWKDG